MPLVCIQCTMKAMVEKDESILLNIANETIEEHMRRVHPDPDATLKEREALQEKLLKMVLKGEL